MPKVRKLKNKINLITIPIKSTKAITVMVLFPVGSRYESKKVSGASHFVEHMLFKGTTKRPTYLDISKELDRVGAEYNAFTNRDYTGYYIKIASENQALAFDMLSDMIFNSKLDKKEVQKEKGVITEEIRMYDDNPTMSVDNLVDQLMFGKNHPMGWDIAGSTQTVKNMSQKDLFNYYKKYYRPENMVLVVAGDINKKNLRKNLAYFEKQNNKTKKTNLKTYKKFVFRKTKVSLANRVAVQNKKTDQAQVIMAFPGVKQGDKKRFAKVVLLGILSGGMSSRLFVEVREKHGLAYMVRAITASYRDCGVIGVQAGLDPSRLPKALEVISCELQKIASIEPSKKELADAKSNLVGRLSLATEDSSHQADWFAKSFWFDNKIETHSQVIKMIKKVTAKEVTGLAKSLFKSEQMRLAVIGPTTKSKVLKMIK